MPAGAYSIARHGSGETRFAFRLVLPEEPGEVQEALHIAQEGSYLLSIKVRDSVVAAERLTRTVLKRSCHLFSTAWLALC